jgi:membrane protease YdiL (CAAX protease family)
LAPGFGLAVLNLTVTIIIFAVVFLGEEIGWRGYLLFRVAELTSGRRAALVTGFFHAIYHLPLLLIAASCTITRCLDGGRQDVGVEVAREVGCHDRAWVNRVCADPVAGPAC